MPTAAERQGDFSQTRTPSGALIVVRDPLTGQPFPNNIVPANRIDPRGQALLDLLPSPNTTACRDITTSTRSPASTIRGGSSWRVSTTGRPTGTRSFGEVLNWFTKSVGWNVAGASSRWGVVRQRYDFFVNAVKTDYTRVLNSSTVSSLPLASRIRSKTALPKTIRRCAAFSGRPTRRSRASDSSRGDTIRWVSSRTCGLAPCRADLVRPTAVEPR